MYHPCLHKNYLSHNFLPVLRIYGSWKMTPGTIICIFGALCWGSYRKKLEFWDFDFLSPQSPQGSLQFLKISALILILFPRYHIGNIGLQMLTASANLNFGNFSKTKNVITFGQIEIRCSYFQELFILLSCFTRENMKKI